MGDMRTGRTAKGSRGLGENREGSRIDVPKEKKKQEVTF